MLRSKKVSVILAGLSASTLAPLQRVLRVAARVVLDLKPRDHINYCALQELHWLPISERVEYKLCFLVHKASLGQSPDYITDLLQPVAATSSRSSLRDASRGDYVVPRTNRKTANRAFSAAAPRECGTTCRLNWKENNRHLAFAEDWKRSFSTVHTAPNNTWYNDYVMRPRSYSRGLRNRKTYANANANANSLMCVECDVKPCSITLGKQTQVCWICRKTQLKLKLQTR